MDNTPATEELLYDSSPDVMFPILALVFICVLDSVLGNHPLGLRWGKSNREMNRTVVVEWQEYSQRLNV